MMLHMVFDGDKDNLNMILKVVIENQTIVNE